MVYLLIGQDVSFKDTALKQIKDKFLIPELEQFNLDVLYAKDLDIFSFQEKLLTLPVKSHTRVIVVRESQNLKENIREFILKYAQAPRSCLVLVLDFAQKNYKDTFIRRISVFAQVREFKSSFKPDAFALSRQIELRKTDSALSILVQLLDEGEKPERILGGLRYAWERKITTSFEARKRIQALLACDIEIKTGRLKSSLALEKMVISLCGFSESYC